MFSSPLFFHVQSLAQKKNTVKQNISELQELTTLYGDELRILGIGCMADEILRDQSSGGFKDQAKIQFLSEEIVFCLEQPNVVSLLSQAFEMVDQTKDVDGRILVYLCSLCKLSLPQMLVLGFALAHSQSPQLEQKAFSLLQARLPELENLSDLSDDIISGIIRLIATRTELRRPEIIGKFTSIVQSSGQGLKQIIAPPVGKTGNNGAIGVANTIGQGSKVAKLISTLGGECSHSVETFTGCLRQIDSVLDELQVAEILGSIICEAMNQGSSEPEGLRLISLIQGLEVEPKREGKSAAQWNFQVVADVLSRECKKLNWAKVVSALDQSRLNLVSKPAFIMIAKMIKLISDKPLPAEGLVGRWKNRFAQLALLNNATQSPADLVDFRTLWSPERILEGSIATPENLSWTCQAVYMTLLQLSTDGLSHEVLHILSDAATKYPEYVFIGLAQSQDIESSVRVELLRRLMPLFSGTSSARPSSGVVMGRLYNMNPDLLTILLRQGFKKASTAQEILEVDNFRRNLGPIGQRVEDEGSIDELLGYWCVMADKNGSDMEGIVRAQLTRHPQHARYIYAYMGTKVNSLRRKNELGSPLSIDTFQVLLRILKDLPNDIVTQEELQLLSAAGSSSAALRQTGQVDSSGVTKQGASRVSSDIEEEANHYFQKIYTSDISISDVIELLKRFKSSSNSREQDIFRCMIHNLFDEYRFFNKYPEKELQITGRLFGNLIQHQLVSSITLGIALRYVLEALRKDPEKPANQNMFRFGKISIEQFQSRLSEWPQYCSHLAQITHLQEYAPNINTEAHATLSKASFPTSGQNRPELSGGKMGGGKAVFPESTPKNASDPIAIGANSVAGSGTELPSLPESMMEDSRYNAAFSMSQSTAVINHAVLTDKLNELSGAQATLGESKQLRSMMCVIDEMVAINKEVPIVGSPPEQVRDQIHFIVNNIAKNNAEVKAEELKRRLQPEFYIWFANYLVVKRISTQQNLHPLYMTVLENLDAPDLLKAVLDSVYFNVTKLLQSSKITTSSSERSLLRNLGMWLGQMTLARNKCLLQRRIDIKKLLLWGYQSGRLIAVCSFVAKIVEGARISKVFRPPNPWLMALLSLLRELYELEDLKMNIKFEVQVLCKNIGVKIEEIPVTYILMQHTPPNKDKSTDFNVRSGGPTPQGMLSQSPLTGSVNDLTQISESQGQSSEEGSRSSGINAANEQTVIPNLVSYININPKLTPFIKTPMHKKYIALAVDRAIREIIQPVIERSVTIACVTTRMLILKDYALEPNEQKLRCAAHMMVSNLAGSLSLVTCKEALRVAMSNHLRALMPQLTSDQSAAETIVQTCTSEHLELGCLLIEKATTEKAVMDIEDSLASAIQARRKHRETGQPFVDVSISKGSRYPRELPEFLKPKAGGLHPQQLQVYEAFNRQKSFQLQQLPQGVGENGVDSNIGTDPSGIPAAPGGNLAITQALEEFQRRLGRLDSVLVKVAAEVAAGGTSPISEADIQTFQRDLALLTHRIQQNVRKEASMVFAENLFKRLTDGVGSVHEAIKVHIIVALLEAVRDACGGAAYFAPDYIEWLKRHCPCDSTEKSSFNKHHAVILLLLRSKLVATIDLDMYLSSSIDYSQNMIWVELSLGCIHQSLQDGIASYNDFHNTLEIISNLRIPNPAIKRQLQKWLSDLRAMAMSSSDKKGVAAAGVPGRALAPGVRGPVGPSSVQPAHLREHATLLLEKWLRIWTSTSDQVLGQFLQLMYQYGVLKTEETADNFFRIACQLCVEACLKTANVTPQTNTNANATVPSPLKFVVVDAISKLFLFLIRLADKESRELSVRVNLLNRILHAVSSTLLEDYEEAKNSTTGHQFDQRPYFRLFNNLALDLNLLESNEKKNQILLPLLGAHSKAYFTLQPAHVPGFAFAWLQLISNRYFMPSLLSAKNQQGWPIFFKLFASLLLFLQPFLKKAQMNRALRKLYRGAVMVLLVLLHDFPDFLCEYHLPFCDYIPLTCVQLRNIVLSAFPRSMRLPDPFSANLKIETLPEIAMAPRLLADYAISPLDENLRKRVNTFLVMNQPPDLPNELLQHLNNPTAGSSRLVSAIVLFLGAQAISQFNGQSSEGSTAANLFKFLLEKLDVEMRYHLLNCMANQLRYPNNQTHFFSSTILRLFHDTDMMIVKEQITRVLLERLIVHRPHPWGLLITFMELIRNQRYDFWKCPFTSRSPEIEKVFESVARSCMGNTNVRRQPTK
jgi:CCR4-NOT transcription complex subunit 1